MEVLASAIREEKEIKQIHIRKEEVRLSLFAGDMILYIGNPKDTNRKFLELICEFSKVAGYKINTEKSLAFLYNNNEYSKVAGYKINTQKFLAFLYTNNEKSGREIKKSIPFTIATKKLNT